MADGRTKVLVLPLFGCVPLDTKPINLNYQGRCKKTKVSGETKAHNDVPLMDDHVQQAVRHGSEVEIIIMMITSLLPRLTLPILLETRALKVKCVISLESLSAANETVKRKKTCFEVRKCEGCLHVFQEDKHFCLIDLCFKMHHLSRGKWVQFHATPKLR